MELFNSLKSRLETYDKPFKHWAINQPLTELAIKEVCSAEIANPISDGLKYDGITTSLYFEETNIFFIFAKIRSICLSEKL